jgi:hypothetical protein
VKTCTVSDLFAISQRTVNDAGFLVAPGVIAKAGNVQTYRAAELGMDGDATRMIRLYRPREEVAKSVATFEGAPITNDHPPGKWVTADNWKTYAVGDTRGVSMVGDDMQATLTVRDQSAVKAILDGKSGLSNGYRFQFDDTRKTTPTGEAVDGWMVDIQGNHTAIVEKGRGGPDCRVADSNNDRKDPPMSTRRIVVDGLPLDLDEVAAAAVEKQQAQVKKLAADVDAALKLATDTEAVSKELDAKLTEATGKLTAADAEIAALKAKVPTEEQIEALAEERATVVADAAILAPDLKPAGKTVDAIRREALTAASSKSEPVKIVADAALSGVAIDKATPEVVKAAFAAARATAKAPTKTASDAETAQALLTAGAGKKSGSAEDKPTGYAAYCFNLTHPKKASAA